MTLRLASGAVAILLALPLTACSQESTPLGDVSEEATSDSSEVDAPADLDLASAALMACVSGDIDDAIARLDSALAAGPLPDGYAVRAGCLRQRHSREGDPADVEAAFADLTRALEASGERTPPDQLYSQRAFVRLAIDSTDFAGMLQDLDLAVETAPEAYTHRLDRSVARRLNGDAAGARADLDWLAARPDLDSLTEVRVREALQER